MDRPDWAVDYEESQPEEPDSPLISMPPIDKPPVEDEPIDDVDPEEAPPGSSSTPSKPPRDAAADQGTGVQQDKTLSRLDADKPGSAPDPRAMIDLSGSKLADKKNIKMADLVEKPLADVRRMLPSKKLIELYESLPGGWSDRADPVDLAAMLLAAVKKLESVALDTPLAAVLMQDTPLGEETRRRMKNVWTVMRLILNRNRGVQARSVDGIRSTRRTRSADFVSAEKRMGAISETVLLVTGVLELDLDDVKEYLVIMRREIAARITKRTKDNYKDTPEEWVVDLRAKMYRSAGEQLKLAQWAALRVERVIQAQTEAVENSVALVAVDDYLALTEDRIRASDEAERQRKEARKAAREQREASAKVA